MGNALGLIWGIGREKMFHETSAYTAVSMFICEGEVIELVVIGSMCFHQFYIKTSNLLSETEVIHDCVGKITTQGTTMRPSTVPTMLCGNIFETYCVLALVIS